MFMACQAWVLLSVVLKFMLNLGLICDWHGWAHSKPWGYFVWVLDSGLHRCHLLKNMKMIIAMGHPPGSDRVDPHISWKSPKPKH